MNNSLLDSLKNKIINITNTDQLRQLKAEFLGKQSFITNELKGLANIANITERKLKGEEINHLRIEVEKILSEKLIVIDNNQLQEKLQSEKLDLSLTPRLENYGSIHPITQAIEELIQVFSKFGFVIKEGPNIVNDWYNFTALNIGENHPARQMHDTFYFKNGTLLRTHTSTVQIKTLETEPLPIRIISPGRTYRSDSDMTHTPMFHQIEGLVIDKDITMAHLKYIIMEFIHEFFEQPDIEIRFRPSFFPFTEPSAEVDIKIPSKDAGSSSKWLEVLGCGMVHPTVLKNCNINPDEYQGFAFGLGVERFAMLKYGIKDLRQFFEGDMRWIKHYNFSHLDIPTLAGGLTK